MSDVLTWLGLWVVPSLLIWLWIRVDEWLACNGNNLSDNHDRLDAEANVTAYERLGRSANR